MKVKGSSQDNLRRLMQEASALAEASNQQTLHARKLDRGDALVPDAPSADQHLSFGAALLRAERADPNSPVDWDALPNLRQASPEQIDRAWTQAEDLRFAARELTWVARTMNGFGGSDLEGASSYQAARALRARQDVESAIHDVLDRLKALEGLEDFPVQLLEDMQAGLRDDIRGLLDGHGSKLLVSDRALAAAKSGSRPHRTPAANMLPAATAVQTHEVETAEAAVTSLARTLDAPGLGRTLLRARQRVPEADQPAFDEALGAFAILADEATHAPDYTGRARGAEDRQAYRARRHAGWGCRRRQGESVASLSRALTRITKSRGPLKSLQNALVKETLREIGVPEHESKTWAAKPEAITHALRSEAFVPLRAVNERSAHWMGQHRVPAAQTNRVVWDMTRSIAEGRFYEWRNTNDGSAAQLAHLTEDQKAAWLQPLQVQKAVDGRGGDPVMLQTEEATAKDLELLWATKIGGPSHGFDTMTHCALALFINARNTVILAKDPRWPNHAGRAYLRLAQTADTEEPILYLEGLKRDFPYPGDPKPLERMLVEHALEKAEAMGARLALSEYLLSHIEDLGLAGEWRKDQEYVLAPSLLVEAASIYGQHDWVATKREVRRMKSAQFHVDQG